MFTAVGYIIVATVICISVISLKYKSGGEAVSEDPKPDKDRNGISQ
jgi:hypothetical protein